jgi:hypothetical protein
MLEQFTYEIQRNNETRKREYQTGNLESLSVITLYSDEGSTEFRNGKIETVFPKIYGGGTTKIYIDPSVFSAVAGHQNEGESHKEYAERMKSGGGVSLGGGFSGGVSSGGGY